MSTLKKASVKGGLNFYKLYKYIKKMNKIVFFGKIKLLLVLGFLTSFQVVNAKPSSTECIAPAGVGGGWDFTCRVPAAQLMEQLGLIEGSMKVTNMGGAGGGVAYANVVNKKKGDENLIVAASMATAARLGQNVYAGYTTKDVQWLGALGADYGIIAVSAKSKYKTLDDLLNAFENNPKKVSIVGASSLGGWDHLKILLLANKKGIKNLKSINYISFDNGNKALLEVIGNRADAFTGDVSEVLGYYDAKKIKILAVLSKERIARIKDVATAKELGYDVVGANWRGFYMPQGVSKAKYNEWVKIIKDVAVSKKWSKLRADNGLEKFDSFGDDFTKFVNEQVGEITTLSKKLGFMK